MKFPIFRSDLSDVRENGWVPLHLDGGTTLEMTKVALWDDRAQTYARIDYGHALEWADGRGLLMSTGLVDLVTKIGLYLDPIVIRETPAETVERAQRGGTDPLERMATLEWARRHDARIAAGLGAKGWDGITPVANAGKDWVRGAAPGRALNYGWDQDPAPGRVHMIQTLGHRHDAGHVDYSQLTRIVRPVGGASRAGIGELIDQLAPTLLEVAKEVGNAIVAGATLLLPDDATPAEWALARALAEVGVHEIPGPVSNARIDQYLDTAERGGRLLHLRGDDQFAWCAAFASWCGLPPGMRPRASVAELCIDARALGLLVVVSEVTNPEAYVEPGDLLVFGRRVGGVLRDPLLGGEGHVTRARGRADAAGWVQTVGGNEGDGAVLLGSRRVSEARAVIKYRTVG